MARSRNDIDKISLIVSSSLAKEGIKVSADDVCFVVKRFFHHVKNLIFNGYPATLVCNSVQKARFIIYSTKLRKLNSNEKKIYFPSSKILSSMIFVNVRKDNSIPVKFYPGDEMQVALMQMSCTDLAYKYIKT
jgi:hypothetical protein